MEGGVPWVWRQTSYLFFVLGAQMNLSLHHVYPPCFLKGVLDDFPSVFGGHLQHRQTFYACCGQPSKFWFKEHYVSLLIYIRALIQTAQKTFYHRRKTIPRSSNRPSLYDTLKNSSSSFFGRIKKNVTKKNGIFSIFIRLGFISFEHYS